MTDRVVQYTFKKRASAFGKTKFDLNPHYWDKMKQAEHNMLREMRGRRGRRRWSKAKYWSKLYLKWIERLVGE